MATGIPTHVKKAIEEGVAQIEKSIADSEIKNSIDRLIHSYSLLDRSMLFGKTTYLAQSLLKLCGKEGSDLILNLLTRGSSEGAFALLGEVKNDNVKRFLEALVAEYGAQYQWLLEPFPNDWERYMLSTKYLGVPPLPIISVKIVDKSGRLFELESPLGTYTDLVQALVTHLKTIDEEVEKLGHRKAVRKLIQRDKLESMKKAIDELLETPEEKQQRA